MRLYRHTIEFEIAATQPVLFIWLLFEAIETTTMQIWTA